MAKPKLLDRRLLKCPVCVRHFVGVRTAERFDWYCDKCGTELSKTQDLCQ